MMLRDPEIPLASATRESVHGQVRALLSGGQGTRMDQALAMEIERLRKLKTKALQARYRELFGEESRSSNRAHLFRRIAWRLQARAEGDLRDVLQTCHSPLLIGLALHATRPASGIQGTTFRSRDHCVVRSSLSSICVELAKPGRDHGRAERARGSRYDLAVDNSGTRRN